MRSKRLPGNRAIARDVSATGIRIEGGGVSTKLDTSPLLEKGEKFEITLDLDLVNRNIDLPVEVMWVKYLYGRGEFEAGLRYTAVDPQTAQVLESYIKTVKQSLDRFL